MFVKAAGSVLNALSPVMHRREAEVLAALPAGFPAPDLMGVADDGDWVAIVISWIDGQMPTPPVTANECVRILRLTERLVEPHHVVSVDALMPAAAAHRDLSGHWHRLINEPLPGLDAWTTARLGALAELESGYEAAIAGDSIVHLDLRTDNMLFGADEAEDVVVDWPCACRGANWIDLVAMSPSLHLDGGPEPEEIFQASAIGRSADHAAVNVFLASIAGFFTRMSLLPPPPGLPSLRSFQAAQGAIARTWLQRRIDLP